MADGSYWRYGGDTRQAASMAPPPDLAKRPRTDYSAAGPEYFGYYPRAEVGMPHYATRESQSIRPSYDHYLQHNGMSAGEFGRPAAAGGLSSHPVEDPRMTDIGSMSGRKGGYAGGGRLEQTLPQDASNTIFVEGLPADCTRREVSHIFRPFVGFKEVRLVNKEPRHPGGDPFVLCFVDFSTASHAAVALDALQGYELDEQDQESVILRLQFARFPGPRSAGGGPRGGGRR